MKLASLLVIARCCRGVVRTHVAVPCLGVLAPRAHKVLLVRGIHLPSALVRHTSYHVQVLMAPVPIQQSYRYTWIRHQRTIAVILALTTVIRVMAVLVTFWTKLRPPLRVISWPPNTVRVA